MPLPLRRLAAAALVALLFAGTTSAPVRAIDIDVDVDVGSPMDMLGNIKKKPKPVAKPAPAKKTPAKPTAKPKAVAKSTAILPAKSEKRLRQNEILVETRPAVPAADLAAFATRNGLVLAETASIGLLAADVHRFTFTGKRTVRQVLTAVGAEPLVLLAQPNYSYGLTEDAAATPAPPPIPQYSVELMHLLDAHGLATGRTVKIGILDTAITDSTELTGSVALRFDGIGATPTDDPSHGTALAGIVAAHGQLLGVAPAAALLSARAFVSTDGKPPASNSFVLLKGLDWLANNGVQVVNMSFAGPSDPLFLKEVKAARDKGILAIAAAGNNGPKAAPDYPAADPSVIGVTAIDDADKLLPQANRGDYVAVAAPGVDILVIAPDGTFSTSSGTSMAAAHVSGAAALLLERDPKLTPDALAKLLTSTALDLGPKGRDKQFGAGLVDPHKALETLPAAVAGN